VQRQTWQGAWKKGMRLGQEDKRKVWEWRVHTKNCAKGCVECD